MAAYTITIAVTVLSSNEVSFTYSPSTLRVAPRDGDTVQWTSTDGPFVIMFTQNTPIASAAGGLVIDAHSTPTGPLFATQIFTVPAGTIGHFHYAVALALLSSAGPGAMVHIDAGCPEIIAN